jgi:hypothetical protein
MSAMTIAEVPPLTSANAERRQLVTEPTRRTAKA